MTATTQTPPEVFDPVLRAAILRMSRHVAWMFWIWIGIPLILLALVVVVIGLGVSS